MKILVINGANLNMLGIREPSLYGDKTYKDLKKAVKLWAKEYGVKVSIKQSNCEGKLVEFIQKAYKRADGIIINAGGYTHTSVCILDALKAVGLPTVEVHLTNIENREEYRKKSYISEYAEKRFIGQGFSGYKNAIQYLAEKQREARRKYFKR